MKTKPAVQTPLAARHRVHEVTEPHKATFSSNGIEFEFWGEIFYIEYHRKKNVCRAALQVYIPGGEGRWNVKEGKRPEKAR